MLLSMLLSVSMAAGARAIGAVQISVFITFYSNQVDITFYRAIHNVYSAVLLKSKGKGRVLANNVAYIYMSQTRDQKRFYNLGSDS